MKNCTICTAGNLCTSCTTSMILKNDNNGCKCPDNYYMSQDSCIKCYIDCLTCNGSLESDCLSCHDGYFLV